MLDTNVLVSGILGPGHSRRLLAALLATSELVLSDAILGELEEVLRIDPRLGHRIPARLRTAYVALLSRGARVVEPRAVRGVRDPGDAPVVGTALAANATLVTGDKELRDSARTRVRAISVREGLVELGLTP